MADKKIAIMQPYLFPYIGYFQLIHFVDKFVVFDDVSYVNRGWINRNNMLINGAANLFSVPLSKASQNKKIHEIEVLQENKWRINLLKSIDMHYRKAPFFEVVFPMIEQVINYECENVSAYNLHAMKATCNYLNIRTELVPSSTIYGNEHLKSQERIIDICLKEQAGSYINPIGGVELYDRQTFQNHGLVLKFLKPACTPYKQFNKPFVPWLSMMDIMFFNPKESIRKMLDNFELV